MRNNLRFAVLFLTITLILSFVVKTKQTTLEKTPIVQVKPNPIKESKKVARKPEISLKVPGYLDYNQTVNQLKIWEKEAPDFVEAITYGKTNQGKDIYCLKICNKIIKKDRPKVMITGCIHGNEPLAAGCVMGTAGSLLGSYEENKDLIESREIYIVPVVSPDSFPNSRFIDKVDPNRDFPSLKKPNHQSTPSIKAIQNLFEKIKPNAVISGHTFGRVYLTPFGDRYDKCPNEEDYQRIIKRMCELSKYRMDRACNNYSSPIHGSEVDWYYRNGAFSVVMEFGTHQRIPSKQEIDSELNQTLNAIKHFIQEAPLVSIRLTADKLEFDEE